MPVSIRILFFAVLTLFLSACAATEPPVVEAPPPPPAPEPPAFTSGYDRFYNEGSLLMMDGGPRSQVLQIGPRGRKTWSAHSDDGRFVVLGAANVDVSGLYLIDRVNRTTTRLHEGAPDLVYTGDFSADGSAFYFGYYAPQGKAMGAGNILGVDLGTMDVAPIGCSASRAVLAAMADGSVLVRNTDNIYQVSADGCDTIRTVDARKMHHVTVSPDGEHMVYILRELEFNRDTRQYEPDSTLYLERSTGSDPVKIIGDKYSPRNMVFSADGTELAFDVAMQDESGRRDISIYSLANGQSSYLLTPASNSPSRTHPSFSPNGNHILFVGTMPSGKVDLMYRTTLDNFTHVIDYAIDASGGMFTMWAGPDTIMITERDGDSTLIGVGSQDGRLQGFGRSLIHILPSLQAD